MIAEEFKDLDWKCGCGCGNHRDDLICIVCSEDKYGNGYYEY